MNPLREISLFFGLVRKVHFRSVFMIELKASLKFLIIGVVDTVNLLDFYEPELYLFC